MTRLHRRFSAPGGPGLESSELLIRQIEAKMNTAFSNRRSIDGRAYAAVGQVCGWTIEISAGSATYITGSLKSIGARLAQSMGKST